MRRRSTSRTATPARRRWSADGRIYVHFGHQGTACLDLAGKVIWKDTSHRYEPVHGNGGSPVLVDGLLVFSCDGAERAVRRGARCRRRARKGGGSLAPSDSKKKFSFCTPTVIDVNGRKQLITPGSGVVNALDPATGREIWHVRYGDGYSVIPKPRLWPRPGLPRAPATTRRPSWRSARTARRRDRHARRLDGEKGRTAHAFAAAGRRRAVHGVRQGASPPASMPRPAASTGKSESAATIPSSPLFADGKIYIQSEEGPALVLKPGKTFTKLADTGFKERTLASYAVGDNALFIRTEKNLYRVEQKYRH